MIRAFTKSSEETQRLAASLVDVLQHRDIVLLVGEMGTGKTTFAQGLGKAMGIDEPITSPTFVLMRSYEAKLPLHHVDVYRMERLQEIIDLGLMEILDEGGVLLMEWGDMASPILPRDFLEIRLEVNDDEDARHIMLRGVGHSWVARERVLSERISTWLIAGGIE